MNLDYRTSEEDFSTIFDSSFRIVELKFPLDVDTNKSRGFAFVEFEDRDSLEKATLLDGTNFHGRNLRILVAEQRRERGGFQRRENPDDGNERDFDNWSRSGPLPPLHNDRPERSFNREREADHRNYDGGFRSSGRPAPQEDHRNYDGGFRSAPRPPAPEDGRDYDHWEHRGPLPALEDNNNNNKFFNNRGPRRDGPNRAHFHEQTEEESKLDSVNDWRSLGPKSPVATSPEPAKPAGRRKLNLAPRSKPLDTNTQTTRSSTLFGAAKPVDTAKKLQEIEERQAKIHQERVEREQKKAAKAKEDKEAKEKLEATRKSFAALSTEDDAAQESEEIAPRKKEELTAAEKLLAAEVPKEELEGDDWNVVVSTKRSGRR